jgi:hypothetical protein
MGVDSYVFIDNEWRIRARVSIALAARWDGAHEDRLSVGIAFMGGRLADGAACAWFLVLSQWPMLQAFGSGAVPNAGVRGNSSGECAWRRGLNRRLAARSPRRSLRARG